MNEVQITVALTRHYADRLRLKGQPVRITDWRGEVHDLRVTRVSMPDDSGRCVVTASEFGSVPDEDLVDVPEGRHDG